MIFKNLLKKFYKMADNSKIQKALQYYHDNDLNEIYGTKNDIEMQKKLKLPINSLSKKSIAKPNLPPKKLSPPNSQIKLEEKINEVEDHIISKPIKPLILSTDQAISKLANLDKPSIKKTTETENQEKFMAINDIISNAKKLAENAKNIDELKKTIENFDGCNLKKMATNTVFADGNPHSKIMLIGEAPGNHEDLEGIPFCGDSGEMITAMFAGINLQRQTDYYITNVIFWRPPGNRKPTSEELAICRPFLERHIKLFDPKIIVLIGATAMTALVETKETISNLRGKIIDYKLNFMDKEVKILTIFHPSFLMRQPAKKKIAWLDMQNLKKFINENQ